MSATRSRPLAGGLVHHRLQLVQRRGLQRGQIAGVHVQVLLDLREAALQPQAHRRGIAALDRLGAALPRLENPAQLFRVAQRIRPVGFDHEGVTPVARVLVAGEVGMDGPGDVAKQLAHGVGGEARRGLGRGRRRRGAPGRAPPSATFFDSSPSSASAMSSSSCVQLLVQRADLLAVVGREHVELAIDPIGLGRALVEHRLELGHPRAQPIEVVRGLFGTDERGHPRMIADPARTLGLGQASNPAPKMAAGASSRPERQQYGSATEMT